jgi:hypothetical protein
LGAWCLSMQRCWLWFHVAHSIRWGCSSLREKHLLDSCASWNDGRNIALVGLVWIVDNYREGDSIMIILFVIQLSSRLWIGNLMVRIHLAHMRGLVLRITICPSEQIFHVATK